MRLAWLGALSALVLLGSAGRGQGAELQGCLLDAKLCKVDEECFDDRVLGRCFNPLQRRPSEMKTYRWFDNRDVDSLEEMIAILFDLGYYWDDDYMQCVLAILVNDLNKKQYKRDYTACNQFKLFEYGDKNVDNEVGAVRNAYMLEDAALAQPRRPEADEATIRFSPSDGLYAEEVFFPPATGKPSRPEAQQHGMDGLDLEPMLRRSRLPPLQAWKRAFHSPAGIPGTRAMRKLMMDTVSMDDGTLPYIDRRRYPEPEARIRFVPNDADENADGSNGDLADLVVKLIKMTADAEAEDPGVGPDPSLRLMSAHRNTPSSFRQGREYRDEDGIEDQDEDEVEEPQVMEAGEARDAPVLLGDAWGAPGPRGFRKLYNTPDLFRAGLETKDVEPEPEVWTDLDEEPRGYEYVGAPAGAVFIRPNRRGSADEETSSDGEAARAGQPELEEQLVQQLQPEPPPQPAQSERAEEADQARKELSHLLEAFAAENKDSVPDEIQAEEDEVERAGPSRAYTEGGLVFLPDRPDQQTSRPDGSSAPGGPLDGRSLDALLNEWRGFERRERLDVKKPGPSYNVNNYYFQRDHDGRPSGDSNPADVSSESNEIRGEPRFEAIHASPPLSMQHKKLPVFSDESSIPRDPNTVSVKTKNGISTWADGDNLINALATALKQVPSAFGTRRVSLNDAVSFKVDPVASTLNASEVAKKIMENKEEIKKRVGVDVQSAIAGRPMPLVQRVGRQDWQSDALLLGSIVLGATLTAAVVSAVTYYAVRRVQMSREKLRGMTAPDTEASKDYQDLCRARMAKKAEAERGSPDTRAADGKDAAHASGHVHADQRLASLSRESEGSNNSPSSRSSTSSWTEEPALTNMDISTGHMVLAYMEDHLKNKDRLEQEWQGLCAYEAEPCDTAVAQKPENVKKNRYYPHVLPYDHSRVVLNELANATGSDYINASTITDHDPRNPAYLATQGPLPHTAADLWQLVWEQGSVVMVMLSRLTENGTAMCHRYWPEEGSELYHIYEVHLVSEHIWCDDYLVRSFYLKNLKTGETRTVTQFHFLSWPDHGVPPNTKPLLDFRRKVNKSYRGRSCPIVVHCSDGAGRTGTYCLIDMVLNRMAKGAKEIDIAATLEHIRDQRANMVESKEQFEFCLQAVADEVHAILKALPAQPTPPATAVAPPPTSPGPEKEPAKQEQKPKKKA